MQKLASFLPVQSEQSDSDRLAHEKASHVRRVAAVGVISRGPRTIITVRTPDGITGTVTAAR